MHASSLNAETSLHEPSLPVLTIGPFVIRQLVIQHAPVFHEFPKEWRIVRNTVPVSESDVTRNLFVRRGDTRRATL